MTSKDRQIFSDDPLFSTLDFKSLNEKTDIISAKKGETIMDEKIFNRCLVFILKGSALVYKIGLDGKQTVINRLSVGDVFGMATLFYEKDEFPSEIVAEKDIRMAVFSKEIVEQTFTENPQFAKAYVTLLSEKIHFLNKKLSAFSEGEVSEKLLRWIKDFADGRTEFSLPCSLSKLAQMLGVGRASVYRAFETLAERGTLEKDGKKIVLLKP